jgi:triosephosphate isomerase
MYLGTVESLRAAESIRALASRLARRIDVVVCPSFPLLPQIREVLARSRILLGAQDVHAEERGPFTGDVSAEHVRSFVRFVIVGHSERRAHHGETDETIAKKVERVLKAGMHPIVCVGETAEERDAGETIKKVRTQVATILQGLPVLELPRILFAYEPVWAISAGLGEPSQKPEPGEVAEVVGLIRKVASDLGERRYAQQMRVLYGGSVTAKTVRPFVSEPGVDGALIGGASTKPAEFIAIVKEILACRS